MSERGSDRGTVLWLSVALGAALLLIAFLLGRESAGPAAGGAVSPDQPPLADPAPNGPDRSGEDESSRRWPAWADLTDENPSQAPATDSAERVAKRIEVKPADSFAATQTGEPVQPQTRPSTTVSAPAAQQGSSVEDYFQQFDLIHSEEGAGDPNAFAMDLIKGGLGGATSGFDQLIADTKQMEREMHDLSPPASCESYHKASVEALVESRGILERMKGAIKSRNIEQLNAIALQSKTLQRKAEAIKEMRRQIQASSAEQ